LTPSGQSIVYIPLTSSASHSVQYFYSGVTPGINFPEFTVVGLLDGQQIDYYDSVIRKMIPKTEWMKKSVGEDYWTSQSQILQGQQENFKVNVATAMQRFNQTDAGVHTRGYMQYGYDGEDFISLDLKTLTWTAANAKAVTTKQKWDGLREAARQRAYLENECIEWLQKYVEYGRSSLERKAVMTPHKQILGLTLINIMWHELL
uniref:MHC class I-like antigen recognition-like domain-containing protein n=1 Tax=Pygocentrus nattereri TaxID=42514 RepID=A0A3B4C138_PYGNA